MVWRGSAPSKLPYSYVLLDYLPPGRAPDERQCLVLPMNGRHSLAHSPSSEAKIKPENRSY
jgi:hypothetical protein